jgi:hypothetical protein
MRMPITFIVQPHILIFPQLWYIGRGCFRVVTCRVESVTKITGSSSYEWIY